MAAVVTRLEHDAYRFEQWEKRIQELDGAGGFSVGKWRENVWEKVREVEREMEREMEREIIMRRRQLTRIWPSHDGSFDKRIMD